MIKHRGETRQTLSSFDHAGSALQCDRPLPPVGIAHFCWSSALSTVYVYVADDDARARALEPEPINCDLERPKHCESKPVRRALVNPPCDPIVGDVIDHRPMA